MRTRTSPPGGTHRGTQSTPRHLAGCSRGRHAPVVGARRGAGRARPGRTSPRSASSAASTATTSVTSTRRPSPARHARMKARPHESPPASKPARIKARRSPCANPRPCSRPCVALPVGASERASGPVSGLSGLAGARDSGRRAAASAPRVRRARAGGDQRTEAKTGAPTQARTRTRTQVGPADGWRGRCGRRRRSSAAKSRTRPTPRRCTGVRAAAVRQHSMCTRTRTNTHTHRHTPASARMHAGSMAASGKEFVTYCTWLRMLRGTYAACGTLHLVAFEKHGIQSCNHAPCSTCTTQRAVMQRRARLHDCTPLHVLPRLHACAAAHRRRPT